MAQKILIVINDAPYGTEKAFNAFRMAMTLQKEHQDVEIRIFLLADAVFCAIPIQKTPSGYYNIKRMLQSIINKGGKIKACGSCSEAHGVDGLELLAIRQVMPVGKKGIEIGIGSGIFAEQLDINYGVDPSGSMLDLAKKRN